ncbi:MAG: 23S rRNA (pseudouridine(1915)-N(3))-methyltransferase RlmH [Candidatus Cloacimonetes bacterium]|nr:23S rRNA (pseudouridine(1915)-N(3))-methyltransferase RlmH [Candidatus Cloacimonadota bacterium]
MAIEIVCLGKTKQQFIIAGIEEYAKRIRRWRPLCIIERKDVSLRLAGSIDEVKRREAAILDSCFNDVETILLDERGDTPDSLAFAELLRQSPKLRFVIGGVYGVDDSLRKRAGRVISLSRLTMTHQLVRLALAEQIYRGLCIINGKHYHY